MKPEKPHLDWQSQLNRLKQRGLQIDNDFEAIAALAALNYYRLRGYFHVFLDTAEDGSGSAPFKPGTSFSDIISLVNFDFRLRALLFEALSQFELRLRTSFAYHGGQIDPAIHITGKGLQEQFKTLNFSGQQDHIAWLEEYKKRVSMLKSENFVSWHLENYNGALPVWAAVEILDFGSLSKLFRSSNQGLSHAIARDFDCQPSTLKSWVASLNDLRNAVAHQNRLWNSVYVVAPKIKPSQVAETLVHLNRQTDYQRHKIYSRLAILSWLDQKSHFSVGLKARLKSLLTEFPSSPYISISQMGFPSDWQFLELWL